jgi:phage major head subunit gpT-like protein
MALITATLLGSINNGLNLAFNSQLYEAESVFRNFAYTASSEGDTEVYPRLDQLKGIREWIGPREVQQLTQSSFSIKNRKFEQTIAVQRTDIEDDKYGIYNVVADEMGRTARHLPDLLMAQLITTGTTTICSDGQYFFSTGHPNYTSTGAATTVSNYASGSSPGWYLIDSSRSLKPFIFQQRIPFDLVTRFNPDDPSVFDNDEFLWGTRGRMNVGFGLWQLAYYSQQPFNITNLVAARTAMALIRRPDGTPMGITPDMVVVPSTLFPLANAYYTDGLVGSDPSTPTTLIQNSVRNMFKPIEYKWLN